MRGWITLHRQIVENPLWFSEPFSKSQAWIDLLILANHKPQTLLKRGIPIVINRGEVGWSETALASRWKWSREKVRNFLKYLKTVQQIDRVNNHTLSRIIILNYDKYQTNQTTDQTTDQTNNNNVNKVNNTTSEVVTSPVLEVNQNDMPWNRLPDDEEEIFIDADGDGTAKPEKKQTKKYPNAPAVRKVFLEVLGLNPLNWNKNVTQLQACENLYTERGIEKIRNALEFYKEHRDLEYCPSISSPLDLDRKYANLSKFKTKITNS